MEGSRGVSRGVGLEQKSPYFMIKNPFIQRKIFLINKKTRITAALAKTIDRLHEKHLVYNRFILYKNRFVFSLFLLFKKQYNKTVKCFFGCRQISSLRSGAFCESKNFLR